MLKLYIIVVDFSNGQFFEKLLISFPDLLKSIRKYYLESFFAIDDIIWSFCVLEFRLFSNVFSVSSLVFSLAFAAVIRLFLYCSCNFAFGYNVFCVARYYFIDK